MTVREPFAYPRAPPLPAGADRRATPARELVADELALGRARAAHVVHTQGEPELDYDALVLALGARVQRRATSTRSRSTTARLDETLHGLIQDVEGGYVSSLAFVAPGRMAWPLPLYELALMTAGRAYDMNVELAITIVTPEDSPLAIFGAARQRRPSRSVLERARHRRRSPPPTPRSRSTGEVVINPGDRHLEVDRVVALPELYGPACAASRSANTASSASTPTAGVLDVERRLRGRRRDRLRRQARRPRLPAGRRRRRVDRGAARAPRSTPEPFQPVIHGMLLTDGKPLYLTARITGGHGFSSEVTDEPTWSPPSEDRLEVPRALPRRARPRAGADEAHEPRSRRERERCLVLGLRPHRERAPRGRVGGRASCCPDGRLVIVHACRPCTRRRRRSPSTEEREQLGRAMIDELLLERRRRACATSSSTTESSTRTRSPR